MNQNTEEKLEYVVANVTRYIPKSVARDVRKNTGFGCVICGEAYYHYEHINPEYHEILKLGGAHYANGITLLCAHHHDAKTRGRLSKERILEAMKNPYCIQNNNSHGEIEFTKNHPIIQIGKNIFYDAKSIIKIDGESILSIHAPIEEKTPYLLSFKPYASRTGNRIENNMWYGDSHSWDITTEGRKIVVRESKGKILLELEIIPSQSLIINKININYNGIIIKNEKINAKKIGSHEVEAEDVFIITNKEGVEIVKLGHLHQELNEFSWENALEIENDYIVPKLSGIILKGGNISLIPKEAASISNSTFNGVSNFNYGSNPQLEKFINLHNKIFNTYSKNKNKICSIVRIERNHYKNTFQLLRHTRIINQLTKTQREVVTRFYKIVLGSLK